MTHRHFCHILLVTQTSSGTTWEGTSYHFAVFLESWSQDATAVLAIPLHTWQHPAEGRSDPVSFKSEQSFPSAPLSAFSLFLIGQNWVTCICLSWSLKRRMGSWCWLTLGSVYLTHLGGERTQESFGKPLAKGRWAWIAWAMFGEVKFILIYFFVFYFNIILI